MPEPGSMERGGMTPPSEEKKKAILEKLVAYATAREALNKAKTAHPDSDETYGKELGDDMLTSMDFYGTIKGSREGLYLLPNGGETSSKTEARTAWIDEHERQKK